MNTFSVNKRLITVLLWVTAAVLSAKAVWVALMYLWLPSEGVDSARYTPPKALYYRVKLTPKDAPLKRERKKPIPPLTQQKPPKNINDLKLLAIYSSFDKVVVTVTYKGKSMVLGKGEKADCFELVGAGVDYAIFNCDGKEYKAHLEGIKKDALAKAKEDAGPRYAQSDHKKSQQKPSGAIIDEGDRKIIDRSLVQYYTKNMKEIGRNVGIVEKRNGKNIEGFEVTFIRKNSDFEKLGLKRGDVIKAVNGQVIDSYQAAMQAYQSARTSDVMTLVVQRGNEEVELEYEIN